MKRNLFAIFLALALVVALAFVVAPTAQAADEFYIVEDSDTVVELDYADLEGKPLDLHGNDVKIAVPSGETLSVIDSKNTGVTGEGAGKLTVNGEVEFEAVDASGRRFMAIQNEDGTYSFHPFYLAIEQIGVNTKKGVLCLQAIFVGNTKVQEKVETGILYGPDHENLNSAADTFGAFEFKDGVMVAYYDLMGSLASETTIGQTRSFQAYIKADKGIATNRVIEITPAEVLENLNKNVNTFTDTQKNKMRTMIENMENVDHMIEPCSNFLWTLVTDASTLKDGDQIVIVGKDANYAMSTNQKTNNRGTTGVTKKGSLVCLSDDIQILTLVAGTTDGTFGLDTGSGYLYAAGSSSNHLKTKAELDVNGSWTITIADGTASVVAKDSSNRNVMQYNPNNGAPLFACYASASQTAVEIYKLANASTSTEPSEPDVSEPDVSEPDASEPEVTDPHEHADENADYICDSCSEWMLPEDGTTLTVSQALAIAKLHASGSYTTQKYYITGTVTGLYNTLYGNFYIKDADGNQICIYGLYKADGTRYDSMEYKPVNGDTVTVYTVLGTYETTYQGKSAQLESVVAHKHDYTSVVTEADCFNGGYTTHTCSICNGSYTDSEVAALGHTTEEGTCERCGNVIGSNASKDPVTASKTIAELITEYGWTSSTTKQSFKLDDIVSVKVNGGSNTGKAYNGDHIRIYATDSPAGTITISVPTDYELVSVKITCATGTYAYLYVDGTTTDICNVSTAVSGQSVILNSVKNGSNGKQVRVTAMEVVYKPVG